MWDRFKSRVSGKDMESRIMVGSHDELIEVRIMME